MKRAGVGVHLWVSHKAALERLGPLGAAWREPRQLEAVDNAFELVYPLIGKMEQDLRRLPPSTGGTGEC